MQARITCPRPFTRVQQRRSGRRMPMKLLRRQFLHGVAGAAALPALLQGALAETYPSRPVHFIVSFAAGGPHDLVPRILGPYPSGPLGQQIVLYHRPAPPPPLRTPSPLP